MAVGGKASIAGTENKLREGITLLRRARNAEPGSFEANWKFAQANYFLGKNTSDDKESARAFKEGVDAGRQAARLAPDRPDGYFWTGANLGGQAQKSTLSGVTSIGEIREAMNKVIEIQPDYQAASAYNALAQIELGTRLTGGSAEKALEYLAKAQSLDKNNTYTYLHMAEAYLALDRKAEARKQIDFLLKIKPNPDFLPEYKDAVSQAKKLLETRF